MCVRCQFDAFPCLLTYCAHRFASVIVLLFEIPPPRSFFLMNSSIGFPLGFLRFTDRIPNELKDAIHTENEAACATSRYKSACKGTTF
jgi:hypothetical protein